MSENEDFAGKRALVTGATGGIGGILTCRLLERGVHVLGVGRDEGRLAQLEENSRGSPGTFRSFRTDLAHGPQIHALLEEIRTTGDSPDILVNNAGVATLTESERLTETEIDEMIQVNLRSVILLTLPVLEMMKQRGEGKVINVISTLGKSARNFGSVYSATKWGLRGFTESLALEYAPHSGISIQALYPGAVDTGFLDRAGYRTEGRSMLQAEDVVQAILFLLSRRSGVRVSDLSLGSSS